MAGKAHCKATTKRGTPCSSWPIPESEFCLAHDQKAKESGRFGGPQPGAGRPKAPRAVDVLRERLEARIDEVLDPLFAALAAEADFGPDHRTRITAVRELLDRVYGKPKQVSEITGANGGPVQFTAPLDAAERSARAARLLKAQGLADGDG